MDTLHPIELIYDAPGWLAAPPSDYDQRRGARLAARGDSARYNDVVSRALDRVDHFARPRLLHSLACMQRANSRHAIGGNFEALHHIYIDNIISIHMLMNLLGVRLDPFRPCKCSSVQLVLIIKLRKIKVLFFSITWQRTHHTHISSSVSP